MVTHQHTHPHTGTQVHEESAGDAIVGGAPPRERKWEKKEQREEEQGGRRAVDVSDEWKWPRRKEESGWRGG